MKQLESFYNDHFKTENMMDWSELTEEQKIKLSESLSYSSYKLNLAIQSLKKSLLNLLPGKKYNS